MVLKLIYSLFSTKTVKYHDVKWKYSRVKKLKNYTREKSVTKPYGSHEIVEK